MQIASENHAFIFDLIKLYEDEPKALDSCLRRILCSSNTLKLGMLFPHVMTMNEESKRADDSFPPHLLPLV